MCKWGLCRCHQVRGGQEGGPKSSVTCALMKRKCRALCRVIFGVLWPHGMACGGQFPNQGLSPCSLYWKAVLTYNTRECPGMPRTAAGHHQKLEEARESLPRVSRGSVALLTLFLTVLELSCGTQISDLPCDTWDFQLQDVGSSSLTRDSNLGPLLGSMTFGHRITREVPIHSPFTPIRYCANLGRWQLRRQLR